MSTTILPVVVDVDKIEVVFPPSLGEAWVTYTSRTIVTLPAVLDAACDADPGMGLRLMGAECVDYYPRPTSESFTGWWVLRLNEVD